jgi:hypothetical protein
MPPLTNGMGMTCIAYNHGLKDQFMLATGCQDGSIRIWTIPKTPTRSSTVHYPLQAHFMNDSAIGEPPSNATLMPGDNIRRATPIPTASLPYEPALPADTGSGPSRRVRWTGLPLQISRSQSPAFVDQVHPESILPLQRSHSPEPMKDSVMDDLKAQGGRLAITDDQGEQSRTGQGVDIDKSSMDR